MTAGLTADVRLSSSIVLICLKRLCRLEKNLLQSGPLQMKGSLVVCVWGRFPSASKDLLESVLEGNCNYGKCAFVKLGISRIHVELFQKKRYREDRGTTSIMEVQ